MQWPSPAKLNLFLYVTGVRADGYHYLQTLFQFLDYSDTLTITVRRDRQIRLFNCTAQIPTEHNLIIRAARLLQHYSGCQLGADISVDKRLPIGAGLGGGSSNAATTLAVLNHLWQCALTPETLRKLALKVGADVPVFLYGQAAFAEGIGERLQLAHPLERWYLVAHPGVSISTAALFNDPALRSNTPRRSLEKLLTLPYQNDFEPIARKNVYKVELLISWLLNYAPTRLTGSGSAVFAEFDTQDAANAVCYKLPSWAQGFVARGVNSSPLQRALSERYSYG